MLRLPVASFLFVPLLGAGLLCGQDPTPVAPETQTSSSASTSSPTPSVASPNSVPPSKEAPTNLWPQTPASPIPDNAPHMARQTRLEIIRDFEAQMVYARAIFPMGTKGLKLHDGGVTPNGPDLQTALALWGPAIKPGDPALLSFIQIKDDHIHFEINGGPIRRKKWYQHIQVSGASGTPVSMDQNQAPPNPHGTYLDLYFDKYVPEMTAQQLRSLLYPAFDFNAKNKEEAYLDTVPPKVKQAILAHYVLVGMNTEMVIHARGKPPKKVRERDGETYYEEWIYGEPPQDVDFVRIVGDEVVRVETMKVGGQKIVRTEKEIILEKPDKDKDVEAKQEEKPANAPSLRRPGEPVDDVPKAPDPSGSVPLPMPPPDVPQPGGGPGDIVGRLN
jgi:hypothetical protein